jgi:hypothetical protein
MGTLARPSVAPDTTGTVANRSDRTGKSAHPTRIAGIFWIVAATLCWSVAASAADPLHVQIDKLIASQTPDFDKLVAPIAGDEEFLRRITLDLTGMIPNLRQAREFLADAAPDKRVKLIDRLLASLEHARHMQREFDVMLMRRLPATHVPVAEWDKFLRDSFAQNKPWDQLVREILAADGSDPAQRGPARFYLARNGDLHEITRDVGKLFLGTNLECAQCHDHPQVDEWKQEHYYGLAAFFVRSFVHTDKDKKVTLAEKADGEVSFESVFEIRDKKSKGPKSSGPKLFSAATISEPKFSAPPEAYTVAPNDKDKAIRPVPKFSRRAKFAEFIASVENRRFCRSTANRLWSMMMGRGIVHPLEMDHALNPPSHPLLLALLTEELAAREMNVRDFLRELALTQTYQRSSQRLAAVPNQPEPAESTFAIAPLKPLTPSQFAWAMLVATDELDLQRRAQGDKFSEDTFLASTEQRFVQLFGGEPGRPPDSFASTADQVLFLANDPLVVNLLKPRGDNLAERLLKLPADNPVAVAEELFLSTLTRRPTLDEVKDVTSYLAGKTGDPRSHAVQELIWAAISSSEFRFNH